VFAFSLEPLRSKGEIMNEMSGIYREFPPKMELKIRLFSIKK